MRKHSCYNYALRYIYKSHNYVSYTCVSILQECVNIVVIIMLLGI